MSARRKKRRGVWLALAVLLVAALALLVWRLAAREDGGAAADGEASAELTLPYDLADGQLRVTELFPYSGDNPDHDDVPGEAIASLAVENLSGKHLTAATITATMADGTTRSFAVQDLPAGGTVWVFEQSGLSYDAANPCRALAAEATFADASPLLSDTLAASADGTVVTLTNTGGAALENLTLYFHTRMDDVYFGGRTYVYPLDALAAGGSATVTVEECYLGTAELVRAEQG